MGTPHYIITRFFNIKHRLTTALRKMKVLFASLVAVFLVATVKSAPLAEEQHLNVKRGWITECLHDCEDLPKGQRMACKADCFRVYNVDDCLIDCERYPAGAARQNCAKHCIIFGNQD